MYNTYLNNMDFRVGIYIRLSQEDKDKKYESDSESVINQKELLRSYVKNNNFNLIKEYVDDGFSGTDFDRPAFKEMLEDIKKTFEQYKESDLHGSKEELITAAFGNVDEYIKQRETIFELSGKFIETHSFKEFLNIINNGNNK